LSDSTGYHSDNGYFEGSFKWVAIIVTEIYLSGENGFKTLMLSWWGFLVGNRHFSVPFLSFSMNKPVFVLFQPQREKKKRQKAGGRGGREDHQNFAFIEV